MFGSGHMERMKLTNMAEEARLFGFAAHIMAYVYLNVEDYLSKISLNGVE